jgi:hypothetical protein
MGRRVFTRNIDTLYHRILDDDWADMRADQGADADDGEQVMMRRARHRLATAPQ